MHNSFSRPQLFDTWVDRYRCWFETPIGELVKQYELALMLDMLDPQPGDSILDAGCGSGLFTESVVQCGAEVIGLDVSEPMLKEARLCCR